MPNYDVSFMQSVVDFQYLHAERKKKDGLRMGQRFVSMYVKHDLTDEDIQGLYFQTNDFYAMWQIRRWLERHHYINQLPKETPQ